MGFFDKLKHVFSGQEEDKQTVEEQKYEKGLEKLPQC